MPFCQRRFRTRSYSSSTGGGQGVDSARSLPALGLLLGDCSAAAEAASASCGWEAQRLRRTHRRPQCPLRCHPCARVNTPRVLPVSTMLTKTGVFMSWDALLAMSSCFDEGV